MHPHPKYYADVFEETVVYEQFLPVSRLDWVLIACFSYLASASVSLVFMVLYI